jgi:hypothetical protein
VAKALFAVVVFRSFASLKRTRRLVRSARVTF